MILQERIANYAYRFWMRKGMTEWPDVRRVAHALNIRQKDIDEEAGDQFQLCGYNIEDYELGDLSVEAMIPAVDVAWCKYWLPYSSGCYCGKHKGEPVPYRR